MNARTLLNVAVLAVALGVPTSAAADTFTVTNGDTTGDGSLRDAVAKANAQPGRDTIDFAPGVTSIRLSPSAQSGALQLTSDLEIDGPGAAKLEMLVFNGRAFEVSSSATATISGMTISHAGGASFAPKDTGGVVLNQGTLTMSALVMYANHVAGSAGGEASGGAIANSGTLTLKDSTLAGNSSSGPDGGNASGGAIANSGTMMLDHARLDGNSTGGGNTTSRVWGGDGKGGGIANTGDLTVVDSTLTGNTATGGTGQLAGGAGMGGAIYNSGRGTLTLRRSTLDGNTAAGGAAIGGGIANDFATFAIENSTISGNAAKTFRGDQARREIWGFGGGIDNRSRFPTQSTVVATTISGNEAVTGSNLDNYSDPDRLSLRDTILANPMRYGGPGDNCGHPRTVSSAFIKSLGYNIESANSFGSSSTCGLDATGDQTNTDPQLKALADNGGPTRTMAIPLSSPALDQGVTAGLTTDQRGLKRPIVVPGVSEPMGGDGSDIGAFEFQPAPGGKRRIVGSVRPGRVTAGERTCFTFVAKHESGKAIRNALVKFAHRRARTGNGGKAVICKRFKSAGVRQPRLSKRGLEGKRLRVTVLKP